MYVRSKQSWFLMAVVLLTACDLRARSSLGVDSSVAQVVVYPDSLTLDPQQSFQFRVFGRTQAGDSVPVSVHWTASAGSVSAVGIYTADTSATDVVVTATLANANVSGHSNVKKRRVIRVVLSPKNLTLAVGALQQFSAYGLRNTGDSVIIPVGYSATGDTSEQIAMTKHGKGGEGKSVHDRAIGGALGDYAHNVSFGMFEARARAFQARDQLALDGRRFRHRHQSESVPRNTGTVLSQNGHPAVLLPCDTQSG